MSLEMNDVKAIVPNASNIRSAKGGCGAARGSHMVADVTIKGNKRTISIKAGGCTGGGSDKEVSCAKLAREMRMANIPLDGANVSYARAETLPNGDEVSVIRHIPGFRSVSRWSVEPTAARSLALARAYGRIVAFWTFTGTNDRHQGNWGIGDPIGAETQPSIWSIDHETAGWETDVSIGADMNSFASANTPVNVPVRKGTNIIGHVLKAYPMPKFASKAREEFRLCIDRMLGSARVIGFASTHGILARGGIDAIKRKADAIEASFRRFEK